MSASPHLDDRSPSGDDRSPTTDPSATDGAARRADTSRRRGGGRAPRWLAALGLALAVIAGGIAIQQVREADAIATANEQRVARADLAAEIGEHRRAVAAPARVGQNAASALLRHQLLLIAGDAPDPAVGERLIADLRAAADDLETAAATPLPERPQILPVATVDRVFDRLVGVEAQAADLADVYRTAADETEPQLATLRELETAAITYAETTDELPSGDDPDTIADAWRNEGDRLEAYATAVAAAADDPAAAPLAEAHDVLVSGLRTLRDDAIAQLEEGDLDAYNALIADRLGGEDPFGFAAALDAARTEVADGAVTGPLETARERGLGLLTELEELRRVTPAQLAEVR